MNNNELIIINKLMYVYIFQRNKAYKQTSSILIVLGRNQIVYQDLEINNLKLFCIGVSTKITLTLNKFTYVNNESEKYSNK